MIGFRSNTPWKKIIALCFYSLCFAGFKFGVEEGIACLIIFTNIPLLVFAVSESIKHKRPHLLYAIPVYIVVASVSIFVVYKTNDVNKKVDTTTENVVVSTDDKNDILVYVTRDGEKYHKQDCSALKNSEVLVINLRQAEENQKTKCKVCFN